MHLLQILLPCADNAGVMFPEEEFLRVRGELAARFGGVTAFMQAPAEGLWTNSAEAIAHDEIVVFEVMAEALDQPWWARYRAELEQRFRQERVIIRHMLVGLI